MATDPEASEVHGNWHGTRSTRSGGPVVRQDAILKIAQAPARRAKVPDALLIFVVPPCSRPRGAATPPTEPLMTRRAAERMRHELARKADTIAWLETDRIDSTAEHDAIIAAEHERFADRRIVV
jgi:hypothetical protein